MAAVHRRDTKPEMIVRRAAHRLGLRFRLQAGDLPGRPDLVFPKWRTVIFVNGCFWHRHEGCKKASTPKENAEFWQAKFAANVARDKRNHVALEQRGWRVLVFWECELRDPTKVRDILRDCFPAPHPAATREEAQDMPAKKDPPLTDEERARRIRELAAESGTSDDLAAFERAFDKIVAPDQSGVRTRTADRPKSSIN